MIKLLIVLSLMLVIPLSANAQTLEDMTFNTTSSDDGQWVNYELPPSLDGVTVSCNPGSGAFFLVGTTNVTCTSTNITGYIGSESFLIDIVRPIVIEPQLNYTSSETSGEFISFKQNTTIIDSISVSNDVGNSYVRMTGNTPYQSETITFMFSDSNQNVIDRYTHVTNYDGSYKAIWTITDYLPDGTYYVTLDDQVRQFEWKSIDSVRIPITPTADTFVEPVEVVTQVVDKEVLDLRLRILQVIESIFRIVLE